MNKPEAHKEFIYQLGRFLQTYFNPGETISTFFLVKALKENRMHPVHDAYKKYVANCGFSPGDWTLTDYSRAGKHMKYCEGHFVKKVTIRPKGRFNGGFSYTQRRNYITVPGALRMKPAEDMNYLLIG
jgi:hypothetical protein